MHFAKLLDRFAIEFDDIVELYRFIQYLGPKDWYQRSQKRQMPRLVFTYWHAAIRYDD